MVRFILKKIKECKIDSSYDTLISCSLFAMKNSYRKFDAYIQRMYGWIHRIPRNAYVRLYIDASVLDKEYFLKFMSKNENNNALEVILYEFPDFIRDEIYHDGTFGSVVRFLSFYGKPFVPKHVKYIWSSDVDMPSYIFSSQNIMDIKRNNADVSYYAFSCYPKRWSKDVEFPIGAGKIITTTKIKYNFKDFENFLDDILAGKYKEDSDAIIKFYNKDFPQAQRPMLDIKYFPYGFDELFVNTYLSPIFSKYRRLVYLNISLEALKRYPSIFETPLPKEFWKKLGEIEYDTWLGKGDYREELKELRKYNKIVRNSLKKDFKMEDIPDRLKICINQYDKYEPKTEVGIKGKMARHWNLVAFVVK